MIGMTALEASSSSQTATPSLAVSKHSLRNPELSDSLVAVWYPKAVSFAASFSAWLCGWAPSIEVSLRDVWGKLSRVDSILIGTMDQLCKFSKESVDKFKQQDSLISSLESHVMKLSALTSL